MVWESEPGDGEVYEALTDSRPSAEAELVVIISLSSLINMPIKEIKQFFTTRGHLCLTSIFLLLPEELPQTLETGLATDVAAECSCACSLFATQTRAERLCYYQNRPLSHRWW